MRFQRSRTVRAVLGIAAMGAATLAAVAPASAAPAPAGSQVAALRAELRAGTLAQSHGTYAICRDNNLACLAQVVTTAPGSTDVLRSQQPLGYGAIELQKIYGLTNAPSADGTVVVIGAGAYPTLESDLAVYRKTYGLPACTVASGCLTQMNYLGGRPYKPAKKGIRRFIEQDVSVETALDVDMASAACPGCRIVSMQVPLNDLLFNNKIGYRAAILHFATGVQTAHDLGYDAASISYGYPALQYSQSPTIEKLMRQKGMAVVTASGDYGANFVPQYNTWPQTMTTVTVAGGTSVYPDPSSRSGYTELAWNGAGSGCATDQPPAEGQPKSISSLCPGGRGRAYSDLSAVADPYTGVAVYDTYAYDGFPLGFIVVGGTSAASPFIGGMYARAPKDASVLGPNTVYADPASDFHDITIGTNLGLGQCPQFGFGNAVCDAGPGWDGPTGVGTPRGLAPFGG